MTSSVLEKGQQQQQQQHQRPVECVFCRTQLCFQVTQSRGKTLVSGGFGFLKVPQQSNDIAASELEKIVVVPRVLEESTMATTTKTSKTVISQINGQLTNDMDDPCQVINTNTAATTPEPISTININNNNIVTSTDIPLKQPEQQPKQLPKHYLFLEEVIFLYERGLLYAFYDEGSQTTSTPMQLIDLYRLLPVCYVPLASYLVYQHLRAQTYRVVRHTTTRRTILERMQWHKKYGMDPVCIQQQQQQQLHPVSSKQGQITALKNNQIDSMETPRTDDEGLIKKSAIQPQDQWHCNKKQKTMNVLEQDNTQRNDTNETVPSESVPNSTLQTAGSMEDEIRNHIVQLGPKKKGQEVSKTVTGKKWWKQDSMFRELIQELRYDAASASISFPGSIHLTWDCYNPDTHYSRSIPSIPDFYVAVAFFTNTDREHGGEPLQDTSTTRSSTTQSSKLCFTFDDLQMLLAMAKGRINNDNTPESVALKIATVSDSGTVLMFGISDYGVPNIQNH